MFGRRTPEHLRLHSAYNTASDAGDPVAAEAHLRELLTIAPETAWAWFDAGLLSKRRRDWQRSADDNGRALALAQETKENPGAWNLGIAATALGDWAEATRAWTAYGIDVSAHATTTEPLVMRLSAAPIRLNPEPRHLGETPLLIDGQHYVTEVVWCQRLCPARARITNVPTPESGHRFGDVVLHDGEPVGQRVVNDMPFSVFNELQVLERSPLPTLEVDISCPGEQDVAELVAAFHAEELGAEDHSQLAIYCRACSEGSPTPHDHRAPMTASSQRIALAADPDRAQQLLQAWAAAGSDRSYGNLDRIL